MSLEAECALCLTLDATNSRVRCFHPKARVGVGRHAKIVGLNQVWIGSRAIAWRVVAPGL